LNVETPDTAPVLVRISVSRTGLQWCSPLPFPYSSPLPRETELGKTGDMLKVLPRLPRRARTGTRGL